jgi:hypothetical protein
VFPSMDPAAPGGDIGEGTIHISGLKGERLKRAATDTARVAGTRAIPCAADTYPCDCVAVPWTRE